MAESIAARLVAIAGAYLGLGIVFALAFVFWGAGRIDSLAREGSWGFRLAILPGTVVLWPLLAKRWLSGSQQPGERNAHRDLSHRRSGR